MKDQVCPTCGNLKKENKKEKGLIPGMKLVTSKFNNVIYEVIDGQDDLYIMLEKNNIKILLYDPNKDSVVRLIGGTTLSELNEIYSDWYFTIL